MWAYRQKIAMRAQRAGTFQQAGNAMPSTSTVWSPVGPAPLASDATGDGGQNYNWVSGRATSVIIDPADASGNTVLLGGAYGGLWRSANAGSQSTSPSAVIWQPLIDDQPTLAVGAIALQPGNSNVILIGTGETNNSTDSYYGLGMLLSANAGSSWTEITGIGQPADLSFQGIGFSKIAFSTANPNLVVAATAGDNGLCNGLETTTGRGNSPCEGPEEDGGSSARGLYYSLNAGSTWNRATLTDGSMPASATSVIYNASQGANGTFYAFIRRHGLYSSTDGENFTRLPAQPGAGLASSLCPASSNSITCLIFRAEFALVPGRNEMYVWIVDVQGDDTYGTPSPADEGIWQSMNGGATWTQIPDNGITNCGDNGFGAASGCGVEQGWYNLELAAVPNPAGQNSSGTDIYAGAINLYKCTLEPAASTACTQGDWINLTHAYGCDPLAAPAHVHPNQHAIAFAVVGETTPGYFAHDGGISRTLNGYTGLQTGSCSGTNQFDSLSQSLGSMTEMVSLSLHPTNAAILLAGAENNGSPATSAATTSSTFQNALGGAGGFTAINPSNPNEWFAANPYVTILKCESGTTCDDAGFVQIIGPDNLGGDQGAYFTPYILDPQNSSAMLIGTCRVWSINTSGTAPLQLSNDFDTLGTGVCTGDEVNLVGALAAGGPKLNGSSSVVYAVTNGYGPLTADPGGEVWLTTNAGVTLMKNVTQNATQNINPEGFAISSVAIDNTDTTGNTAYVGIMGFSTQTFPTSHVWQTTNAGETWSDWTGAGSTSLPDNPVNTLLVDSSVSPSQIYAGTDVGVFVTSSTTASWTEVGPMPSPTASGFLPNAPVTALEMFNPDAGTKTLMASTYGRGIWSYVLITSPAYSNVISNSPQTVFPTQNAIFNGTLTSQDGYASPVNLICSGGAPATCSMLPAQITPTATYTVTAGGAVGNYSFNAHAVGTDPYGTTRDATATLYVVDFNLTAPSPNSLAVSQGGTSAASTFQVTASGSFSGTVILSCPSGLPAGAACVFSPSNSVSPTSSSPVTVTLTVTAAAGTPVGGPLIVTLAATVAGAPAPKTQTFLLTVSKSAGDFAIAVTPTPNTTVVNQNIIWNGTLTALNGYSGSVTLACTAGEPSTCIPPQPVTPTVGGAPFAITLGSATVGTFNFTIQATDGSLTHATPTETLTVTAAASSFTWTDTGSATATVLAGQSASYTFSAAPAGGTFGTSVSFACSNLPALTTCSFNPLSIAAGASTSTVTLTITTVGPNLGLGEQLSGASREASIRRDASPANTRSRISPFLALAWAALIAMVGVDRKKRRTLRLHGIAWACLGLGLMAELSCGGLTGSGSTQPPVIVNPGLATLFADEPGNSWPTAITQQQFSASQSVTWAVTGGDSNGTIDSNGLYTTPAAVPNPATATVTATSPASTGSAFVTVAQPTALGTTQITVTAAEAGGVAHSDVVTLTVQ